MIQNPLLAPRSRTCALCKTVATIDDVTMRLYDGEGFRKVSGRDAVEYLRGSGLVAGDDRTLYKRVASHAKHIDAWLAKGKRDIAPIHVEQGLTRIAPPDVGPVHWLDVQQQGMEIGAEAMRSLASRMAAGDLKPVEEVQLAKLGLLAATGRSAMEARGKGVTGIDKLLRLASGLDE